MTTSTADPTRKPTRWLAISSPSIDIATAWAIGNLYQTVSVFQAYSQVLTASADLVAIGKITKVMKRNRSKSKDMHNG
jgi:hypothetical protein